MTLRADIFTTAERAETRFVAFRDTITIPDEQTDVRTIDLKHCRQGRFGCGFHFLITTKGDVQLGRPVETIGSHSRHYDRISVGVGVVGGLNEEGKRAFTRTVEQQAALDDMLTFLQERYPLAELNDVPHPE